MILPQNTVKKNPANPMPDMKNEGSSLKSHMLGGNIYSEHCISHSRDKRDKREIEAHLNFIDPCSKVRDRTGPQDPQKAREKECSRVPNQRQYRSHADGRNPAKAVKYSDVQIC